MLRNYYGTFSGASSFTHYYFLKIKTPPSNAKTNSEAKRKNKNFAIAAAPTAICVNPKSAATKAIARKINDQRSII